MSRDPRQTKLNRETGWAIGIDVGGTKIAAAAVSFPLGELGAVLEIPTKPERGGAGVLRDVEELAAKLSQTEREGRFFGIGVGVCELVTPDGELLSANCIGWKASEVRAALRRFGTVKLDADVRAAARAEAMFGAGTGASSFLYVTVGTGISCCLVIDGEPFAGTRGATGTMASGPFPGFEDRAKPSLEAVASGPGLVLSYKEEGGKAKTAEDVLAAAEAGEEKAMMVARRGARALGGAIGWLISVLDPELVVMGGGLGLRMGLFRDLIIQAAREHVWWEGHRQVRIVSARTGTAAGVIGAAAGVWKVTR